MLATFATIITDIILPIFVLVAAGILLERRYRLDVNTISKLTFFVFVPSLLFKALIESQLEFDKLAVVAAFQVALIALMLVLSMAAGKAMRLSGSPYSAFLLAAVFCNSANFGIPLVRLAFPTDPDTAVSYQAITIMIQNLSTFSLGLVIVNHGRGSVAQSLKQTLRYPFLYVVAAALLLKYYKVPVMDWKWFWSPVKFAGDGLVAIALLTLGIQIAKTPKVKRAGTLAAAVIVRLAVAPAAAFALVWISSVIGILDFHSILAQLLVIAAAGPSAVNTVLISLEFKSEPDFAAAAVFYSTLFSALSVAVTIFLVVTFM